MKLKLALAALLLVTLAQAEDAKKYHNGKLLQMESLQCTVFENQSANASDSALCHEYVLQGDDLLFHLRAKDVRRPVLLPVGKQVGYRMEEDRFYLRLAASDKKEHEYLVLSIEPREKSEARVQTALKVNHLQ
ncbi:MAG: hypothetical protein DMG81_11570 [Acidobacteria bacterium]|nr:MAG: hypothetical protein DMG81_11570 [Acidobacteriota bacterium]